ncbi:hypothetical protein KVT40_003177 [Elsinoe batatas]|uniref:Uncharacterized protein n=1 Tax=Elsinoe batatas TaxID=2601811 RepID=A0A8K0PI95_9PEZI|nr:hypothetical protein KVT40_003177 [Elsinoe batatas]
MKITWSQSLHQDRIRLPGTIWKARRRPAKSKLLPLDPATFPCFRVSYGKDSKPAGVPVITTTRNRRTTGLASVLEVIASGVGTLERERSGATLHSLRVVPRLPRRHDHLRDGQYHQYSCFAIAQIYGAGVVQMALSPPSSSLRGRENSVPNEAWTSVEARVLHKSAPEGCSSNRQRTAILAKVERDWPMLWACEGLAQLVSTGEL